MSRKFIVSATTRDASPEAVEIPWTRQTFDLESDAVQVVVARNRAELAVRSGMVWGYYEPDLSPVESGQEPDNGQPDVI